MYVTAHRVGAPMGDEGVNSFLHLHGAQFVWPDDPASLPERNPGALEERRTEVPPGGNRVIAYLDVLAPDGTGRAEIDAALADLGAALDGKANPTWCEHGKVTIRFGVEPGIEKKGLEAKVAALTELGSAVDGLLARLAS
ncbi:MAG: hypothetical protein EXR72_13130 [Myxococcales bacterium]|nr:hypothetical protein [Myxococcales bacterium]